MFLLVWALGSRRFWQEKKKSQKICQKNGQIFWPHFIREFPLVFFTKKKWSSKKKAKFSGIRQKRRYPSGGTVTDHKFLVVRVRVASFVLVRLRCGYDCDWKIYCGIRMRVLVRYRIWTERVGTSRTIFSVFYQIKNSKNDNLRFAKIRV